MTPDGPREDLDAYVRKLERENQRLLRTNRQLARERLGLADSAAAAALDRLRNRPEAGTTPPPGPLRRVAARVRRGLVLLLPHGIVLARMRRRDPEDA